jgi:hypothetical protein
MAEYSECLLEPLREGFDFLSTSTAAESATLLCVS